MADILRKSLAPISVEGWEEIEGRALEILKSRLTARKIIDVNGPHGWEKAAINLGRLSVGKTDSKSGVDWGLRQVQPLIETRAHFEVDQMELDSAARGATDIDLDSMEKAAEKIARFEENAIYSGFKNGQIKGILESSSNSPLALPNKCSDFPPTIVAAINQMKSAAIDGPYALVLDENAYQCLMGDNSPGYPTYRMVERMVTGGIFLSQPLNGGVLISLRGGDFELTLGQDISIGYKASDSRKVELYFTESFTFRVLEPAAAVVLKP